MAKVVFFGGVNAVGVIPKLQSTSGSTISYDFAWRSQNDPSETFWLAGSTPSNFGNAIAVQLDGKVQFRLNEVNYDWSGAIPSPEVAYNIFLLEIRSDGVTDEIELFVNGGSKGKVTITASAVQSFIDRLAELNTINAAGFLDYFNFTDNIDPLNNQWYALEEGSGTLIADSSGNGKDGTLSGDFAWQSLAQGLVTITDAPLDDYVYQRDSSNAYTTDFDVTFDGAPTFLQYRLLDATNDTTEIISWTTFDSNPVASTSVLNASIPAGIIPYHIEVRSDVDLGDTFIQTVDWFVGCKVLIYGQSLALQMSTHGAITPQTGHSIYDGSAFSLPTVGAGSAALANKIIDMYGCACSILNMSVSGSSLTLKAATGAGQGANYWANKGSTNWVNVAREMGEFTDGDGVIEFALWIQGTTDAVHDVSTSEYLGINDVTGLNYLLSNSRELWSANTGVLPFVLSTLGRNTSSSTDEKTQAVRNALITMCNVDDNMEPTQIAHLESSDGTHLTDAGYVVLGENAAVSNSVLRDDVVKPPVPVSAEISGADVIINFDNALDSTGSSYDTQGVMVSEGGVNNIVNSLNKTGTKQLTITLSTAVIDQSDVNVYLGYGTGLNSLAVTYPKAQQVSLLGVGGNYNLPVPNFNIKLSEV